jgi:hypothetical protein
MKKIVACLFILCHQFATSQSMIDVGLHASSHISAYRGNIHSNEPFNFQGYSIGLRSAKELKKWDLQAGLLFTQMDLGTIQQGQSELSNGTVLHLQTRSMEVQALARRRFNRHKRIVPYAGAGVCNFLFTREVNFDSSVDPQWFAQDKRPDSRYNISLLTVVGVKCKLDHQISIDLEPNFKYFLLQNTNYRHNISAGLAVTCNYLITRRAPEIAD